VRSRVEVVADVADDGRPVLVRAQAEGAFAVRATGPGEVHLVGTAAGPLNGDDVEMRVVVRAGARLTLRGVAATIALPGRVDAAAAMRFDLVVEDGGTLVQELPPLVVCRGARLRTTTRLALAGSARADLTELVVLGRHGEVGGDWRGRLTVDRDGGPVLRTTQRSDVLHIADDVTRAVLTRFVTVEPTVQPDSEPAVEPGSERAAASTVGGAVRCPLAGGDVLVTAIGANVPTVTAEAAMALQVPTP
jgi:urease accessory protein